MGVFPVEAGREVELNAFAGFVGDELGARFEHPYLGDFVAQPEPFEDREISRQQRLPDVEAGMPILFEEDHVLAPLGNQCRGGRTAGPATNDQDLAGLLIVRLRIHHRHPVSVTILSAHRCGKIRGKNGLHAIDVIEGTGNNAALDGRRCRVRA